MSGITSRMNDWNASLKTTLAKFDTECDRFEVFKLTLIAEQEDWSCVPNDYIRGVGYGLTRAVIGVIQAVAGAAILLVGIVLSPIFGTQIMKFGAKHLGHGLLNVFGLVGTLIPGVHRIFIATITKEDTMELENGKTLKYREMNLGRSFRYADGDQEQVIYLADISKKVRIKFNICAVMNGKATLIGAEANPFDPKARWCYQAASILKGDLNDPNNNEQALDKDIR